MIASTGVSRLARTPAGRVALAGRRGGGWRSQEECGDGRRSGCEKNAFGQNWLQVFRDARRCLVPAALHHYG